MAIFKFFTWYSPPKYNFFSKIFFVRLIDTRTHKKMLSPIDLHTMTHPIGHDYMVSLEFMLSYEAGGVPPFPWRV